MSEEAAKRRKIWKMLEKPEVVSHPYVEDLRILWDYWKRTRTEFKDDPEFQRHMTELRRRVVIETGQIEGVYDLDEGTTEVLIHQGYDAALIPHDDNRDMGADQIVDILDDQQKAYEIAVSIAAGGTDIVSGQREFGEAIVKELHAVTTRNQDHAEGRDQFGNRVKTELLRGTYKTHPNNPSRHDGIIEEYCPPEQVGPQMAELFRIYHKLEAEGTDPIFLAAWFHHAFTTIHPFQDGNGRLARVLATVILVKQHGLFFHIERGTERKAYIDALRMADDGKFDAFVSLVARQQKLMLIQAIAFGTSIGEVTVPPSDDPLENAILSFVANEVGNEDEQALAQKAEKFFEPFEAVISREIATIQRRIDPTSEKTQFAAVKSRLRKEAFENIAQAYIKNFLILEKTTPPMVHVRASHGGNTVKNWIWCAEPKSAIRGLIMVFVDLPESENPLIASARSLLPLVGDVNEGPERLLKVWNDIVKAILVSMIESLLQSK